MFFLLSINFKIKHAERSKHLFKAKDNQTYYYEDKVHLITEFFWFE